MRKQSKNRNFSLGKKGIQGRQVIPEPFGTKIRQISSNKETQAVKVAKQMDMEEGVAYDGSYGINNVITKQNELLVTPVV